jgi:3,4-dihydroxy 2-butanone 4-phosphate synthase/GTP cyclohydrolase II
VLSDDPQLTVRLVEGEDPRPIVVDSRLRFPTNAAMLDNPNKSPWIATLERSPPERQAVLEAAGAKVLRLPADSDGRVDLDGLCRRLHGLGIKSLMVEGGTHIITSFLAARLVDRIILTLTPFMVGGLRAVDNLRNTALHDVARLGLLNHRAVGSDLVLWGELSWEDK